MPTVTAGEVIGPIAFAIFVGITTIQCHYQGAVRVALTLTGGVALALSAYLFSRSVRERRDR